MQSQQDATDPGEQAADAQKRRRTMVANIGLALLAVLAVVMVVLALTTQRDGSGGAASATPGATPASGTGGASAAPSADPSAASTADPSASASPVQQVTPQPADTSDGSPPRAVFLGDDATAGSGGDGTRWSGLVAQRMGWVEVNLARGGTGYVASLSGEEAGSACGQDTCPAYRDMVNMAAGADPDVIVVSGGRHDGGASVTDTATMLFRTLKNAFPDARIVVVSPLWDATEVPADLVGTERAVRAGARAADVEYADIGQPLAGRPDLIAADGTNPNAAGHRAVAEAVLARLQ